MGEKGSRNDGEGREKGSRSDGEGREKGSRSDSSQNNTQQDHQCLVPRPSSLASSGVCGMALQGRISSLTWKSEWMSSCMASLTALFSSDILLMDSS